MPDFRGFAAGDAFGAGEIFHDRVKDNPLRLFGDDDRKKRYLVEGSGLGHGVERID